MAPPYRVERDRGSKEFPQQLEVLRERWPLAFPTNREDVRPLAMGTSRQVAATMGWSPPIHARRADPMENGGGLLPSRAVP
jgi:hypothetical protein